jgi:AraC-like DNA-binding protein
MQEETVPPAARLLFPRPRLAGLIYAAVVRDTRHKALRDEECFNFFPASPFCSVSWIIEGRCYGFAGGGLSCEPDSMTLLPRLVFSGPSPGPGVSWSPAPVLALTIAFYPEAWQTLTGIDPAQMLDRNLPVEDVITGELLEILHSVFEAPSCEEGVRRLEDALGPFWQEKRGLGAPAQSFMKDWVMALSTRAIMSGAGRSARQIQRRIKSWTGQTHQTLNAHARVETLFGMTRRTPGNTGLAQLAAEGGFADQSHMSREVRRITGFPPARINRLIATDECFWLYRLLGERF